MHEHPDRPLNSGAWDCTGCGNLNGTPEKCPGWYAYQGAQLINRDTPVSAAAVLVQQGHLVCPQCGAKDTIVEHDTTSRTNGLSLHPDGHIVADPGARGDYETDYFECQQCDSRVDLPRDLEVHYPWSN
ncbi:hypothetical protein GCM10009733_008310 [Nonomuraea maheshkhaliensis]|uniref:C2H2-type domain-containing protein n=1 Tax=Nonomuraea maheshkhaliensis TaxID=419590 RepID=A0ABP4QMA6_9ACTN